MRNKLMKKTAVVMASVMLMALAACGSKTPEEVLNEAAAKTATMKDMDMTMTMDMTMAQDEQSMDMNIAMDMKASGMNTEAMLYSADASVGIAVAGMDQTIDTLTFYQDGYCYVETMGQKVKYAMDLETMMESVEQSSFATGVSAEEMQELSMTKDGDNQILTFVADPVKMNDTMQEAMGIMDSTLGATGASDITMKEVSGTYVVNKDGYFSSSTMKMVFEMDVEGSVMTVTGDVTMNVNNPGQSVEVTIPDTEGYEEIEM